MSDARFTPHNLAEILRDLFLEERSGCLILASETGEEIRIHFCRGLIDLALQAGPHLEFLGDLSSMALEGARVPKALQEAPPDPATLATFLGEKVLSQPVREAVRRETLVSIQEAFRLSGGSWRFEDGDSEGVFDPDVLGTLEAILKGIGAVERWARVARILTAQKRLLKPSPVPLFPVDRLPLAPEEGYLLSLMDGQATFEQIGSLFPGSEPDQVTRFIYSSLVLGVAQFDPALTTPFRLEAYEALDRTTRERAEKERERIERFYRMLRDVTPYQVLGITDGATWSEIKQAYDIRKNSYLAERFLPEVRHDLREELQIIETGLVEVYLKIQSLRMDAANERSRERAPEQTVSLEDMKGKRLESTKTTRQAEVDEREKLAEQYLIKAREAFRDGDFHNTVEFCNLSLKHADLYAEAHALLGRALAKNPTHRWQIRAEQALLRAVEIDPWNPLYYQYMGDFYLAQKLDQRAQRYFDKARELSPNCQDDASIRPRV